MMFLEDEIIPYRILENQKAIMYTLRMLTPDKYAESLLGKAYSKTVQLTNVLYPMVKYSEEKLGDKNEVGKSP